MRDNKNNNMLMEITVSAYQVIEKKVSQGTRTSGRVYVPKEWIGRTVKIFLMDEPDTTLETKDAKKKEDEQTGDVTDEEEK